ncbi:GRP family sugar transporter [[Eubacterium] cellulosolvens]
MAILSMFATGISDFFYKRARNKGAHPAFFLAFQSIFFNMTNFVFILFSGSLEISLLTIFFGFICGSLVFFSVYLFLKSLGKGGASVNVPIFRLSFIVTAVLAIFFLQEPATFGKIIAICLAAFSILALSKSLHVETTSMLGVIQLIFATFLYGLFGFFYKLAILTGATPLGILFIQGISFITYAFTLSYRKGLIKKSQVVMNHAPICGILLSASYLLLLMSLKFGEVSISFSIVQLSFVITSILAIIFWKEKINILNLLGIIAAFMAVILFAYL